MQMLQENPYLCSARNLRQWQAALLLLAAHLHTVSQRKILKWACDAALLQLVSFVDQMGLSTRAKAFRGLKTFKELRGSSIVADVEFEERYDFADVEIASASVGAVGCASL